MTFLEQSKNEILRLLIHASELSDPFSAVFSEAATANTLAKAAQEATLAAYRELGFIEQPDETTKARKQALVAMLRVLELYRNPLAAIPETIKAALDTLACDACATASHEVRAVLAASPEAA